MRITIIIDNDFNKINRQQNRYSLEEYPQWKEVLRAYMDQVGSQNVQYEKLPYGYSKFNNGIIIEPWMRDYFSSALYPTKDDGQFSFDDKIGSELKLSPYSRLSFQKEVFWQNPFCTNKKCRTQTSKSSFWEKITSSSPDHAVDLTGEFFFSAIEKHVWLSRPDVMMLLPEPHGHNFEAFKNWFKSQSVLEKMVKKNVYNQWLSNWEYHKKHHHTFHKKVVTANDLGVNVYGWHGGAFSIGIVARKIHLSAQLAGIPSNAIQATMEVSGKKYVGPSAVDMEFTRSCSEAVTIVVMNADCSPYFFTDIPANMRRKKYNIGYWNWELEIFPSGWMSFLESYDEIWVPTMFNKLAIQSSKDYDGTLVKVIPIPQEVEHVDAPQINGDEKNKISQPMLDLPSPLMNLAKKGTSKPFTFMVVFDFGSYVQRKNPAASIRAFLEAFPLSKDPDGEKYQLIMKSHGGTVLELDELQKVAGDDPRIIFLNSAVSEKQNIALHRYQDCHVSLHRSEGYGMNILESMASRVPVIATNYSGNTIFFDVMPDLIGTCSFPIPYKLVELTETYGPYQKGNHWAEADITLAAKAMQKVVHNECQKSGLAKHMQKEVIRNFGFEAIGEKIKDELKDSLPRIIEKTKTHKKRIDKPKVDETKIDKTKIDKTKTDITIHDKTNEKKKRKWSVPSFL